MSDQGHADRTEPASALRLQRAREEGDVPRSRDLATVATLLAGAVGLGVAGGDVVFHMRHLLARGLGFPRDVAFDMGALSSSAAAAVIEAAWALAPLGAALLLAALGAPLLVGGWVFAGKAVAPRPSRLNPMTGLGRMVSVAAAVELAKAAAKAMLVGACAWVTIRRQVEAAVALADESATDAVMHVGKLLWSTYLVLILALAALAALDVAYQLRQYHEKLKMTKEELKREAREAEGNPEVKAKVRQIQRAQARRRMMAAVPTADVVITNPTHYAVALRYADGAYGAPRVVAKGADAVAARIRALATEHGVPLLEAPPLARALHQHTEIGDEIPEALYSAVAEVLAYVFQLKRFEQSGGPRPEPPAPAVVPPGLDPLADVTVAPDDGART